jgi:hypothetical protein
LFDVAHIFMIAGSGTPIQPTLWVDFTLTMFAPAQRWQHFQSGCYLCALQATTK